jgi:hypothetical protein
MSVLYHLDDVVQMKKPHACGENLWQIIRLGMDIRIKCQKCGHSVLIPRARFDRLVRKIIVSSVAEESHGDEDSVPN